MVKRLEAELIEKTLLAPDLFKIVFAVPEAEEIEFEAGQFMSVAVNGFIRRSYSLSNSPSNNRILETYADVSPHGPAAKFFHESVVGMKVNVLAPLGHFLYKQDSIPVSFFATGTGVVPFLSMIQHELEVINSGREVNLYLGVRSEERLIWQQMLAALEAKYANFHYIPFVSQPVSGWSGKVGRITDMVNGITDTNMHAYICGGKVVIDDVERLLLERGVAGENIFFERYY